MWIKSPKEISVCSFIKTISFKKEIKSVRLSCTSMGYYYVLINGNSITNSLLNPGYTSYHKRVQIQRYDVTQLITKKNLIEIQLAPGWGGTDYFGFGHKPGEFFYFKPALYFSFDIIYADGSIETIESDTSWDVYENEYEYAEIYNGEIVNPFREKVYLGKAIVADIDTTIVEHEGLPVVEKERISAKKLITTPNGEKVIDFEQNFAGFIEIKVKGNKGDKVSFTMGEILDKDGNFYNKNYRSAKAFYSYVLTGEEQVIKQRFSFLGGRYIKLIDFPSYMSKENFTAVLIYSDMERTGTFECGNKKINRLYQNVIHGQISNYIDIPTDCPQRDERLGWTGDAQAFVKTASINYNTKQFFKKWLRDMALDQYEDGSVDGVIPLIMSGRLVSSGWGDAAIICPFEIYKAFGDKELLKEHYPMMEKWINFLDKKCTKPFICKVNDNIFGDWLALDQKDFMRCKGSTDLSLISTAFYKCCADMMTFTCNELGLDATRYENLSTNIKNAYRKEFIENGHMKGHRCLVREDVDYSTYTQTSIVLTLYFDLCAKEEKITLINDLKTLIRDCGGVMTTGFLGTPYILYALSDNGCKNEAYDLLFQEKSPSWLFSVNNGATTMWEHWDGINENGDIWPEAMNSFNHYAYGAVYGWMFNNCVGVNIIEPGYKEVLIKPLIEKRLGYVNGTYKSKYGTIKSSWRIDGNQVVYDISIPIGIKAKIMLEDGFETIINGGDVHHISTLE